MIKNYACKKGWSTLARDYNLRPWKMMIEDNNQQT